VKQGGALRISVASVCFLAALVVVVVIAVVVVVVVGRRHASGVINKFKFHHWITVACVAVGV